MSIDDKPQPEEVFEQLNTILKSRYFSNSDVQSKLLRLIVKNAVANGTITQQDLNGIDGTNYAPDSNKGRQNVLLMRRKVLQYYANEGAEDLIIITLPPGRAYKALYYYHPNARDVRVLQKCLQLKSRMTLEDLLHASNLFVELIASRTKIVRVYVEYGETVLLYHLMSFVLGKGGASPTDLARVLIYADDALKLDAGSCHAYMNAGIGYIMRFEYDSAADVFAEALKLFPDQASKSLWYAAYLVAIGKITEAVQISQMRVDADKEDATCNLVHSLFLYLAKRYEEAEVAASTGIGASGIARLQYLVRGLIALELHDFEGAYHYFRSASEIHYFEYKKDAEVIEIMNSVGGRFVGQRDDFQTSRDSFRGLLVLALMGLKRDQEANEYAGHLARQFSPPVLQSLFAFAALGESEEAVRFIEKQSVLTDPFLILLPLLPMFDRLDNRPGLNRFVKAKQSHGRTLQEWFRIR